MYREFSTEDVYTMRKAIVLKQCHTYWDQNGLLSLSNLELLSKEFGYDALIKKIYDYMFERVNERLVYMKEKGFTVTLNDYEYMFRDQPMLYNEEVLSSSDVRSVLYNVHDCFYRNRLVKKYQGMRDVIDQCILMG